MSHTKEDEYGMNWKGTEQMMVEGGNGGKTKKIIQWSRNPTGSMSL